MTFSCMTDTFPLVNAYACLSRATKLPSPRGAGQTESGATTARTDAPSGLEYPVIAAFQHAQSAVLIPIVEADIEQQVIQVLPVLLHEADDAFRI